jgi:RES domain-containing protein
MQLFRVVSPRFATTGDVLSGKAPALLGGLWNAKGDEVIYTSVTTDVAVAEHWWVLPPDEIPATPLLLVDIYVGDSISRRSVNEAKLPENWNNVNRYRSSLKRPTRTQKMGSEWLRKGETYLLFVPSRAVPGGKNCLINPLHPEVAEIAIRGHFTEPTPKSTKSQERGRCPARLPGNESPRSACLPHSRRTQGRFCHVPG